MPKDIGVGVDSHWLWATSSVTLFLWGMRSYRKGFPGDSHLMPFKAFCVASLFVGASSAAAVAFLHASGIHNAEDALEAGANLRTRLGIRPRTRDE